MIAESATSSSKSALSAKYGRVSVPEFGPSASEFSLEEPSFHRGEACELLETLGRDLGMSLLPVRMDAMLQEGVSVEATLSFPDEATRKTAESLDVVWIQGTEVVAAFVVEAGPDLGEGVRRLADLLALHPKWKAPLFVVSEPALRAGLGAEFHRPIHRLLKKPMTESVRILDWARLQHEVLELGERVRYLRAEFLAGISEAPAEL
ncbi:MAG: hypothetical protein IPK50_11500 [Fibrobacterota bacterium]|nr:hypothetical protein [Fibrobacterota bacterium]QQS07498.1 MAG: hypothetical protein IPK50_11500 [Fibrobacterota bacterium]